MPQFVGGGCSQNTLFTACRCYGAKRLRLEAEHTENDTPKLAKTREPPNYDFLSSVSEPLDSFKYAEIKS